MFNNDIPIKNLNEDLLDRHDFSKQLANAISEYDNKECLTIGLYGSWGSGKTSILNLFENNIHEISQIKNKKYTIIRYEPWIISNQDQLINQFFKQLSLALKKDIENKKLQNIANILITYSDALSFTSLIPVIGKFGALATFVGKKTGETINKIVEARNTNIQEKKDIITKELSDLDEKFIFIIDDIDRLTKIEIQEIFKLVKAIANFPNMIYILAFDRDIVVEALNEVQTRKGDEFLEKIVQIPFKIPEPQGYTLKKYFFEKFNNISTDFDTKNTLYINSLYENSISFYAKSIRDINRLLNSFYLNYLCLKKITHCVDLLGITTLQIFEHEIYINLYSLKNIICGDYNKNISSEDKEYLKKELSFLLDKSKVKNVEATKNLLSIIFPIINNLYEKSIVSNFYSKHSILTRNHICCIENFPNYFTFSLDKDRMLQEAIKDIIFNINISDIEKYLIDINKEGKINDFLDSLYSYFKEIDDTNTNFDNRIDVLLLTICKLYTQFFEYNKTSYKDILKCSCVLLQKISNDKKRLETLNNLFLNEDVNIEIIFHLLNDIEVAHERYKGKITTWDWREFISINILNNIEQIAISRFSTSMLSGELFKYINENESKSFYKYMSNMIIYFWESIDKNSLASTIKKLPKENINLIYTISTFETIDHNYNPGNSNSYWYIKRDSLESYFEINETYEAVINYFKNNNILNLDTTVQLKISAFIYFCRNKDNFTDNRIEQKELELIIIELTELFNN